MPLELHEIFLILTSIFSTAAVFNLTLFFGFHKKLDYLFFAFYCAFHVFKVWLKTFDPSQILISGLNLTAYDMIYLSVIMGLLSLNIFLLHHYGIENKRRFYAPSIAFAAISFLFLPEPVFIYAGLGSALMLSFSVRRKRQGMNIYFAGLLIYLLLTLLGHLDILPIRVFHWNYWHDSLYGDFFRKRIIPSDQDLSGIQTKIFTLGKSTAQKEHSASLRAERHDFPPRTH